MKYTTLTTIAIAITLSGAVAFAQTPAEQMQEARDARAEKTQEIKDDRDAKKEEVQAARDAKKVEVTYHTNQMDFYLLELDNLM